MQGLTPKQKRFCEEYVIDFNGTQAAIRAGYSAKTATVISANLLTLVKVKEYVEILQLKLKEQSGLSAEMVINELKKCGFANIQHVLEVENEIVDISKIDSNKAAAISSVKTTTKTTTYEGETETTKQVEVKFHDKIRALENLGKHLGIFEKDNNQQHIKIVVKANK